MIDNKTNFRSKATKYIELSLGGGMIDVELDKDHYDMAIDKAISKYRQRSSRAVEESFMILNLSPGASDYTLPDEVIDVKVIYRASAGGIGTTGTTFEPFEAAYLNMYMLGAARGQGLLSFELFMDQREQLGQMFGAYITFTWSTTSKRLSLHRLVRADERVTLHTYNYRPDETLLQDTSSGPWLREYATAAAKLMLGQARSKFSQLAGPQGGVTLNGNDLIAQGTAEMEKLEDDLKTFADGGTPLSFFFG
jgi:hypothetical protein